MGYELESLQRTIYRLVTAPGSRGRSLEAPGASFSPVLDRIIVGDDRLSAAERIRIYAEAYFYRLLEVMKEDYPATLAVLGDADFEVLVADYLSAYPPRRPSVFHVGQQLAEFLAAYPARFPFVADLALLERALIEAFHGRDEHPLDEEFLRAIPVSQWPALALRLHPTARVLDTGWRVGEIRRAVDSERAWREPERMRCWLLVWRHHNLTWYRELEKEEWTAFASLSSGASLAAICEAIAAEVQDEPSAAINRLLHRWVADGVLAGC